MLPYFLGLSNSLLRSSSLATFPTFSHHPLPTMWLPFPDLVLLSRRVRNWPQPLSKELRSQLRAEFSSNRIFGTSKSSSSKNSDRQLSCNWRVCNSVRFLVRASLFCNTSVKQTLIYSEKADCHSCYAVTLITEGYGSG